MCRVSCSSAAISSGWVGGKSDQIYRAMLLLTTITGCQGRNGGGWAHYVGQEKIRPIMGFQHLAFALDWHRPPRHMNQTAYWYVNTSQYRYDTFTADDIDADPHADLYTNKHKHADKDVYAFAHAYKDAYTHEDPHPNHDEDAHRHAYAFLRQYLY